MATNENTSVLSIILNKAEQRRTLQGLKETSKAAESVGEASTDSTRRAVRGMRDYEASIKAAKQESELLGDTASRLSSFSGVLSSIGGSALGELGMVGADLLDAAEGAKNLRAELPALVDGLLKSGPLTSKLSGAINQLPSPAAQSAAKVGLVGTSLAAMGISAIAAATAFEAANRILEQSAVVTRGAIDANEEYYTALFTLTTQQVAQRAGVLRQQNEIDKARLAELKGFLDAANANIDNADALTNVLGNAAIALGVNVGGIQDLQSAVTELQTRVSTTDQSIGRLNQGLEQNAFHINDQRAAIDQQNQAWAALQNNLKNTELQTLINLQNMDAEAAKNRIESLENETEAKQQYIHTSGLSREEMEKLTDEIITQRRELAILRENLPALEAAARIKEQQEINRQLAEGARQYEKDRQSIIDDGNQAALRLQEQYADKVTDIVDRYVEDTAKALESLQQRSGELAVNAERETNDELQEARFQRNQDEIAFTEESAANARALQRRLKQIRLESADSERSAIRDRNFAQLDEIRTQRNRQLKQEVDAFNDSEKERAIQFKNEKQAENRRLEFQAEVRQQAFAREIADLQVQYQREINVAAQQREKQLKQLQASTAKEALALQNGQNRKLQILQDGVIKELDLIRRGEEARLQIRAQADQAYLAMAQNMLRSVNALGSSTTNNSLTNANTFNIQSGGGAQQQAGLVNLIAQVVNQQLGNFFN